VSAALTVAILLFVVNMSLNRKPMIFVVDNLLVFSQIERIRRVDAHIVCGGIGVNNKAIESRRMSFFPAKPSFSSFVLLVVCVFVAGGCSFSGFVFFCFLCFISFLFSFAFRFFILFCFCFFSSLLPQGRKRSVNEPMRASNEKGAHFALEEVELTLAISQS
jgi:hypothetical protein